MADGARFLGPTFQPHNQHIAASFSTQNNKPNATFPGAPPNLFSAQSKETSMNPMRGHAPQKFLSQDGTFDRTQRFLPQFRQNHSSIQQDSAPVVVPMSHIQQQQPPQAVQFSNTNKTFTNPGGFPGPGQMQFVPNNSTTNLGSNIPQNSNLSAPFRAAAPQILQHSFSQGLRNVPVRHGQPGTFPMPFSGPISVPPPPTSVQFPPPLPGNMTAPAVHLTAPPVIQTLDSSGTRTEETTNQEWVNNFLKQRGIEKPGRQSEAHSYLKLHEAKQLMTDWMQLISELSLQRDKLAALATSQNNKGWQQELEKAEKLKSRVEEIQAHFSCPEEVEHLEQQVLKRKKKREWQKKRRKEEYAVKKETENRKSILHKKIDEWRSKIIAEDEAKRRAESMKHEAGGVLGEVKRKQTEVSKAVELLKALRKLREARKQEAEVKGVYVKPTEAENRDFEERVKWLENVMSPRRELYEAEEKTLRVMLAEEEEEKEKERREIERKNLASLGLSDPMDWFRSYYKQAEHSLPSLLQIRRQWDAFLVPDTFPGASRIPDGSVIPLEPSSEVWATALIDKG